VFTPTARPNHPKKRDSPTHPICGVSNIRPIFAPVVRWKALAKNNHQGMFDIERIIESTGVLMDKTKQPSSTKEQRIRYLKALLKKADQNLRIRDQERKKLGQDLQEKDG